MWYQCFKRYTQSWDIGISIWKKNKGLGTSLTEKQSNNRSCVSAGEPSRGCLCTLTGEALSWPKLDLNVLFKHMMEYCYQQQPCLSGLDIYTVISRWGVKAVCLFCEHENCCVPLCPCWVSPVAPGCNTRSCLQLTAAYICPSVAVCLYEGSLGEA